MDDLIDVTAARIENVVSQERTIPLSKLEYSIDASYNIIFLAVERLVAKGRVKIAKEAGDYIISQSAKAVEFQRDTPLLLR